MPMAGTGIKVAGEMSFGEVKVPEIRSRCENQQQQAWG